MIDIYTIYIGTHNYLKINLNLFFVPFNKKKKKNTY